MEHMKDTDTLNTTDKISSELGGGFWINHTKTLPKLIFHFSLKIHEWSLFQTLMEA